MNFTLELTDEYSENGLKSLKITATSTGGIWIRWAQNCSFEDSLSLTETVQIKCIGCRATFHLQNNFKQAVNNKYYASASIDSSKDYEGQLTVSLGFDSNSKQIQGQINMYDYEVGSVIYLTNLEIRQ